MAVLSRATAVVLALTLAILVCLAQEPKGVPPAKVEKTVEPVPENAPINKSRYSKLTLSDLNIADAAIDPRSSPNQDAVRIGIRLDRWTLDYEDVLRVAYSIDLDFNRINTKNFTIAKPSIDNIRDLPGMTQVVIHAKGNSGAYYRFDIHSFGTYGPENPYLYPKDTKSYFIHSEKGSDQIPGGISIQTGDIKRFLTRTNPVEFTEAKGPLVYVRLLHNAVDDGHDYKLKAWTGKLVSNHDKITLNNW